MIRLYCATCKQLPVDIRFRDYTCDLRLFHFLVLSHGLYMKQAYGCIRIISSYINAKNCYMWFSHYSLQSRYSPVYRLLKFHAGYIQLL